MADNCSSQTFSGNQDSDQKLLSKLDYDAGDRISANINVPELNGNLSADILYGADQIAEFLYGTRRYRRRIYNLFSGDRIPHFRLGATLCARKSVLLDWIACQESNQIKRT